MNDDCRYPDKRRYDDERDAKGGAEEIRRRVHGRGQQFMPLYPYRCPTGNHWHLSSARQGRGTCPQCGTIDLPAWFDGKHKQWVIYAHGECPIQSGMEAVANV